MGDAALTLLVGSLSRAYVAATKAMGKPIYNEIGEWGESHARGPTDSSLRQRPEQLGARVNDTFERRHGDDTSECLASQMCHVAMESSFWEHCLLSLRDRRRICELTGSIAECVLR